MIKEDVEIPRHRRNYGATRLRLINNPTLYFSNAEGTLELKVYDKARELAEVSSWKDEYIRAWDGITGGTLQRVEIRFSKESVREFCRETGIDEAAFLELLCNEDARTAFLSWGIDRLLFFSPWDAVKRKKGDRVSLFDVVLK